MIILAKPDKIRSQLYLPLNGVRAGHFCESFVSMGGPVV